MTKDDCKPPDPVASARHFQPLLKDRADEIEVARRIPQDIADAFAEAGFYALCVPADYGGLEASPITLIDVVETLAIAEASSAWCVFIGATAGLVSAYLPNAVASSVYGPSSKAWSTTISAGVFAPRGRALIEKDGYRVSGQWQWGSGATNAEWVMGGCITLCNGEPELMANGLPANRLMLVRASEVEFLDNWHVSGLCGTGSADFAIHNQLVPFEHSVNLMTDRPLPRPLYAFPIFGLLSIGVSAVILGLARAAIDELVSFAGKKTPDGTRKTLAGRATVQSDIAEAEALYRSARLFLHDTVAKAWEVAQQQGELTLEHRRDIRLAASHAANSGARAVDVVYRLGGGTSVYKASPLQRYFRDVHTATQHMVVGSTTWEQVGRLFLGVPSDTTML
ncbi:flavin-dependent monooxygenase [Exilibacterium tricleocarpae]|uniref:Flavin-dependent monooxygenase n=1 Tax=Exilibacterium tricleocarpae TaxID=2591008 RepID=A0A545SZ14_9GAMM|nr:acyl-CoA dehydrogenase family protein [Exilibacterium tricleocarpae]TQV70213.1 flavin-dependent monooxygenase [Exilibacterium tricleocarpae]